MLQDILSPTKRRENPARLSFGNPGFFLALSAGCLLLSVTIARHLRYERHDPVMLTPVALTLAVPLCGFLIHAFRWPRLSLGQRIAVLVLLSFSILVCVPVLQMLPIVGRE